MRHRPAILCCILLLAILGGGWLLLRDAHRSAIDARTRTTFVANVSHELKTPLTTIRMYAEILNEGRTKDESRRAHYLDVIVQESQRLTRLINNVLDFSRLEQGRKTYRPEDLDLATETRRIVEAQNSRLQAVGLAVELEGADTPCPAHADRDAFEQALLNVLDNAAKYAVSGKRVLVHVASANGAAQVRVCDRGPGVPAAHRSRLFQQFHRADDSLTTRQPGCGLGLSISRRLLRDQGGDLRYETAENGGACFVLTLPTESERYTVEAVADGKAALASFQKQRPDLVLLDIMMPELSGYDVCRAIRRTDARTPVILLTAKGEEIDKVVGLELGADDYVTKPFGVRELLNRVWGLTYYGTTRTLDQHIAQLRKKVEIDPETPTTILTVHGVGYRYVPAQPIAEKPANSMPRKKRG